MKDQFIYGADNANGCTICKERCDNQSNTFCVKNSLFTEVQTVSAVRRSFSEFNKFGFSSTLANQSKSSALAVFSSPTKT